MAGICLLVFLSAGIIPANTLQAQESGVRNIPGSAFAAVTIRFKDAIGQPSMALVPHELIEVFGDKEFGVDLMELERLSFMMEPFEDLVDPPNFGFILEFSEPQDPTGRILDEMMLDEVDGRQAWTIPGPPEMVPILVALDETTCVFCMQDMLDRVIDAEGNDSKLLQMMSAVPPSDHFDIFVDLLDTNSPGFYRRWYLGNYDPIQQRSRCRTS